MCFRTINHWFETFAYRLASMLCCFIDRIRMLHFQTLLIYAPRWQSLRAKLLFYPLRIMYITSVIREWFITVLWHTSPFFGMKPFVTVHSSFSSSASYVIAKSRNHGAIVASISRSRSSGTVSFKGFSSQNSVSSVFSFQEFIPLNVSNFYCLLHWYTQFCFLNNSKNFYKALRKLFPPDRNCATTFSTFRH